MPIPNIIADFRTTLALKVAATATTATLSSITDEDGDVLPNGTYGFTIDRKNSNKEYIECTLTGTALSAVKTVDRGTGEATSGFALAHRKGAEVIISDFVAIKRLQDVFETGYPEATSPSTDYQLATKKYVDDLAFGGATTVDRVTVAGNAGESVSAGDLVYLKLSDSEWYLTDADTVATIDNVVLGIAQGSGTDGNAITSGILIKGVDANLSGLTPNSLYYASNTAGGVAATTGTNTRVIGVATDTDKLFFDPEFNKVYKNYAVDSVGTDSYAITLQSAFGALYAGMEVTFKAGTANTGACTLAVNGLTAKTIKKDVSTDLATGDILQNQIVKVVYDGTNFQMVSPLAGTLANIINPVVRTYLNAASPATWNKPAGLKYVVVEVQGAGSGGDGGTQGGTSSFGTHCSATGGLTSGGVGSDGDINITGTGQQWSFYNSGSATRPRKHGGIPGVLGSYGMGGGINESGSSASPDTGAAGGYSKKLIAAASLGSSETVTIGAGTAGGTYGKTGGDGIVIVTEYYS